MFNDFIYSVLFELFSLVTLGLIALFVTRFLKSENLAGILIFLAMTTPILSFKISRIFCNHVVDSYSVGHMSTIVAAIILMLLSNNLIVGLAAVVVNFYFFMYRKIADKPIERKTAQMGATLKSRRALTD